MLANNVDGKGLANGKRGHDGLHTMHLHDPHLILLAPFGGHEADLVATEGPRCAAGEDVEELPLRLHEDAVVAVPELLEVLLLAAGEAAPSEAVELVAGQVDIGHGEEGHLTPATIRGTMDSSS